MPPALLEAPCSSQVHDVDERFSLLVYGSFGTSGANSRAVNFVSRRVVIRKCSIPGVVCLFHELGAWVWNGLNRGFRSWCWILEGFFRMGMKSKRTFFFTNWDCFFFELLYLLEGGKGGEGAWKIVSRVGCTFFFGWMEGNTSLTSDVCLLFGLLLRLPYLHMSLFLLPLRSEISDGLVCGCGQISLCICIIHP
jgi:hypothetical protein